MTYRNAHPRKGMKFTRLKPVLNLDNSPDPYRKPTKFVGAGEYFTVGGWTTCGNGLVRGRVQL